MTTHDKSEQLVTRTGLKFTVRPARPDDKAALAEFFKGVTPEDLRFRFLTTVREVSHSRLAAMTDVDHALAESFVALKGDTGTIIATAMLAWDQTMDRGEVAISVREEDKNKGVGWELLGHVARFAEAKGLKAIESLESRQNRQAIELEMEHGFETEPYPDDATLIVLRKRLRGN